MEKKNKRVALLTLPIIILFFVSVSNALDITAWVSVVDITPKPDLIVEDIWYYNSGTSFYIYYKIKNQGNANASSSYSGLWIDDSFKSIDFASSLTNGSSRNEYFYSYLWVCSGATDTIKVCADTYGYVSESDELNNCRTETFSCPSACMCSKWKIAGQYDYTDCRWGFCYLCTITSWTRDCNPDRCATEYRRTKACTEI
jgi:hypothetical protein